MRRRSLDVGEDVRPLPRRPRVRAAEEVYLICTTRLRSYTSAYLCTNFSSIALALATLCVWLTRAPCYRSCARSYSEIACGEQYLQHDAGEFLITRVQQNSSILSVSSLLALRACVFPCSASPGAL